eukprot:856005-Pelagomonas_calceolata.AAC.1
MDLGHAAYDVLRGICDMCILGWESTPVIVCKSIAIEASRMIRRKLPPICQVMRPDVCALRRNAYLFNCFSGDFSMEQPVLQQASVQD